MTAFADFIDLQTAVVELVKRPDIADVMPRLVKLAEADFSRRLRMAEQIDMAEVDISGGSAPLPFGLQSIVGVYGPTGAEYIAQPPQAVRRATQRGIYAIFGGRINAPVDETLSVQFYGAIPTIADDPRSSNWLLDRHPGLYLYGVGLEAAKYIRDADLVATIPPVLAAEYAKADGDDSARRYARGRIRLNGITP
jgi:hypothetical protein